MDDEALAKRIGERLRAIRRGRGLTLQEVSDASGVTMSRLSRIELAERELSVGALLRLSRALGVSVNDLLGEPTVSDPVAAMACALPADPEETRERLIAALRVLAGE